MLITTQSSQRNCFARNTNRKLCGVLYITDSRIPLELPEVPEVAVRRTEGDVFPGISVSSRVSQPHIVTSICHEISCNT